MRAANEAKQVLAQMELEEERLLEGIDEECRQLLNHRKQGKTLTITESDEENFDLNKIEDIEDEEMDDELMDGAADDEDEDSKSKNKVSHHSNFRHLSTTYQGARVKQKPKIQKPKQRCWQGLPSARRLTTRQ